ncbi:MAG: zf-HC2 domain-containing protein [Eubacterium sp.]|nr:zf-HC2 domain-containing protein [Eubacterium sp.]
MNEANNCDVVQDLLPGYIDDVLSNAGSRLVKKHLEECRECHKIYAEMKDGSGKDDLSVFDAIAVDGFKKVRSRTMRLKMTIGILAGMLLLLLLSAALKVYVIGKPLETGYLSIPDTIYDEETGRLTVNGKINLYSFHVSKVTWEEDENDSNVVNIVVYHAETLPFLQDQTDYSITIPDVKGKQVYLACPKYDRREIYDWRISHGEEVERLKTEIYGRIAELNSRTDALSCQRGITTVEGMEGICFSVDFIRGENSSYWWFNDMLTTDGEMEPADFEIWISLEEPHVIRVYDYQTGGYTDDFSIISDRKGNDAASRQRKRTDTV